MDIIVMSQSDELEEQRKISDDSDDNELENYFGNRKWEWGFLRASFECTAKAFKSF
jgi:hypothetical protein